MCGTPATRTADPYQRRVQPQCIQYFNYAPALARRIRLTLPDLRGRGRSEMPAAGYSAANRARDLTELLDHRHIDKAHFLAHSFGGVPARG